MRPVVLSCLLILAATPVAAQQRPGPGGRTPLPAQWIPFDSLAAAVGLTLDQHPEAARLHTTLDSLMRRGAELRGQMREEMQGSRNRDRMRALRDQLEFLQADVEKRHTAIRTLLTAEQHAAFDALRAPQVIPARMRRG